MVKARAGVKLLAGCLLCWGGHVMAQTPTYTQADMLGVLPSRQDGGAFSTPSQQEIATCTVEKVTGGRPGVAGYLLRDPRGQTLRRFLDTNGDRKIDVWSFYKDGVEVYREVDSDFNQKADQFRWFNTAGSKCGISAREDGKISGWKIISAEEVSQETLQAIVTKDLARLQALFLSDAEMQALGLSATEAGRIRQLEAGAAAKFQATLTKLTALNDKTQWVRLEASPPACVPADQTGGSQDLIKYVRATLLYENGGKHDFLNLGEIIQVGLTWRLIDAPTPGDETAPGSAQGNPELQKLLEDLRNLDARAPKEQTPGPNPEIVRYNLQRAELIQRIIPKDKPDQQELWVRQVAECLSAAAQSSPAGDRTAYERLLEMEKQVSKESPGSNLAAFVTFREMQAEYSSKINDKVDFQKMQTAWVERLAKFVQTYPKAEDTPEALMQLGMVSEFINQETQAKNAYNTMARDFATHPLAAKAKGAVRRLESEGKVFELAGPTRNGAAYDINQSKGKLLVVYYWASWNQQCVGDFARLKVLLDTYGPKGLELVCVNLDNSPPEADSLISRMPIPGIQVMQTGGLESPLATAYGIMSLPNLFLVDKEGKVQSRTIQVGGLEDEIKKQLK